MRIQAISTNYYLQKNNKKQSINKSFQPKFEGIVNNHVYSDNVIELAKKYMNVPNWKEKVQGRRGDFKYKISNWQHEFADEGATGMRVLAGILSLGFTEVTMGLTVGLESAIGGALAKKEIDEIQRCMDDLRNNGGEGML